MLVLSRRPQEAIVIPGLGVTIYLVAVEGKHVRVGIEAPPEVKILREELLNKPADAPPALPDEESGEREPSFRGPAACRSPKTGRSYQG